MRLLTKDIASKGEDQEERDKQVVEPNDSNSLRLYRIKRIKHATRPHQQTHISSIHDHNTSRHNNVPMIHALLPFPMPSFLHVLQLYVFLPSLRLTQLADPALVTSVYPNRMQYTPRVLQEASLLDGVDASVHGNGRRFSKTSSYPPCRHYAFTSFYPYLLTTSLSPLFSLIHLFPRPTSSLLLPYKSLLHSLSPLPPYCSHCLTTCRNIFYLWQNNVVKDPSQPLSYLV